MNGFYSEYPSRLPDLYGGKRKSVFNDQHDDDVRIKLTCMLWLYGVFHPLRLPDSPHQFTSIGSCMCFEPVQAKIKVHLYQYHCIPASVCIAFTL